MKTTEINRKIIISSPITDRLAGEVIDHIMEINTYDEQMAILKEYQPEPIEMYINSVGGSASAGFAIIGAMEMSETPIITFGMGIVASMALAIFVAGDVRIAHRFARFMYHQVSYGEDGFLQDHIDSIKEISVIQDMYNSLFLDRTKFTKEMMKDIGEKKKNFFFSGKKAVKFGVADDILLKPEKKVEMVSEEEYQDIIEEIEKIKNEKE